MGPGIENPVLDSGDPGPPEAPHLPDPKNRKRRGKLLPVPGTWDMESGIRIVKAGTRAYEDYYSEYVSKAGISNRFLSKSFALQLPLQRLDHFADDFYI